MGTVVVLSLFEALIKMHQQADVRRLVVIYQAQ